jgi:hypothetical protein
MHRLCATTALCGLLVPIARNNHPQFFLASDYAGLPTQPQVRLRLVDGLTVRIAQRVLTDGDDDLRQRARELERHLRRVAFAHGRTGVCTDDQKENQIAPVRIVLELGRPSLARAPTIRS